MFLRLVTLVSLVTVSIFLIEATVTSAQESDDYKSSINVSSVYVGQQFILELLFTTRKKVDIELDQESETWGDLEVIRLLSLETEPDQMGSFRHHLKVLVAIFVLESVEVTPAVRLTSIDDKAIENIVYFSPIRVEVVSSFDDMQSLSLSSPPSLGEVDGARSPALVPFVIGCAVAILGIIFGIARFAYFRNLKSSSASQSPVIKPPVALDNALLEGDVVEAYRLIAFSIREFLQNNFDLPASALTTAELGDALQRAGVNADLSRLSRDLLRECDAVIYAGYRPATGRRNADFQLAKTVLENYERDGL
tara:strand:- start:138 stop:1061 length:924 start_codon:yes stop_codon:yes gene_type:complete